MKQERVSRWEKPGRPVTWSIEVAVGRAPQVDLLRGRKVVRTFPSEAAALAWLKAEHLVGPKDKVRVGDGDGYYTNIIRRLR